MIWRYRHEKYLERNGGIKQGLLYFCPAIHRINTIETLAITQYWFRATNAADTPVLQLKLYQDLLALRRHFPALVDAVISRLQTHLYFLCEEMTALALASDLLDDAQRSALAKV